MEQYDDLLRALQQQVLRAKQLDAMIADLRSQREGLEKNVRQLEQVKLEEQADVDRLERKSLAAFFYNVIGKMDEKLDEERRQAYAARVKYDTAVRSLASVNADLRSCETERDALLGCEIRFETALKEKAEAVRAVGGEKAERILMLENKMAQLDAYRKELAEAISAGTAAYRTSDEVMDSLDSAEGYGTWDMLGGGLIADLAKHSHLDTAQAAVEKLQVQLGKFKTELADVTLHADMQVNIDGFLRFADYFFDGLFADWAVMDEIHSAQEQLTGTQRQISNVINKLQQLQEQAEAEQKAMEQQMENAVLEA